MKLVLEILTGVLFVVEVGEGCTVAGLKDAIAAQEELPRDRIIFVLEGDPGRTIRRGEDGVPIVELGFRHGSHVYLFLEPEEDNGDDP
ncbi:hypothetical protein MLD38_029282 [Melastoma candidum]|uniref:Uncharacterized protein n=1 Tax=Melastoma candidum TaxID=119954 RepID=A0ACB9N3M9_9MYRT|nr:hypothetical protein MLD38_029282 [Melastoma candidum]